MTRHLLVAGFLAASAPAFADTPPAPPLSKFDDFDKVVNGAKEYDGLFKLYQKDEHLFAEIEPNQFDQPFLCPIAVARGVGMGGHTLNFDEQWVLRLPAASATRSTSIRRNVHFQAKAGSPVAKAVETTYTDSRPDGAAHPAASTRSAAASSSTSTTSS